MAEVHFSTEVFVLRSDDYEDAVLRPGDPYRCKCGKVHSPTKSPCRDPPMDAATKETQRRQVIDFRNLLSPVRDILHEYNLLTSWRNAKMYLEDIVRIALITPSHAREIVRFPITRIKELLDDIWHPLQVVAEFSQKHDHLTARWNRIHFQVVEMTRTLELLEDIFAHDLFISDLRRERGLGLCGWTVLFREGLSRSLYKFQRSTEADEA